MESVLAEHLGYVADSTRLDQFREAFRAVIRPGERVVDLGAGSGILSLLALQAGAGHVVAIDETSTLELARETLTRAAFAERVTFIRGRSQQVELRERVDVAVCDHVGWFGFDYGVLELMGDARKRFLKPGGRLVPARIRLQAAVVDSGSCRKISQGWVSGDVPAEFHWVRRYAVNCKHPIQLEKEQLLSRPADLGTIDLTTDQPDYFCWSASLSVTQPGLVHGVGSWFECELAPGIWMTNSPLSGTRINRSQVFLPIEDAVAVESGERIELSIMARPAEQVIAWNLAFPARGKRFSHSTWQGLPLSPIDLARANPSRIPLPSSLGRARGIVLGYCNGTRTVAEVEQAVLLEHPDLLPSQAEIRRFVAQVLAKDAC